MKTLMQVTSPREIAIGSVSFAYQIIYREQALGDPIYCNHKIIVIHGIKPGTKLFIPHNYSVHVRYYFMCKDGRVFRNNVSSTRVGYYNSYDEAYAKVCELIQKRGTGTVRQWEQFYKARVKCVKQKKL